MLETVFARIDDRREDLVDFTRELIRIPTVNPPGDLYEPCARLVGDRLRRAGFEVEYVRAEGAPGDSDRYPRINVVGRIEGDVPGPTIHFNGHLDVVEAGHGWTLNPFAGVVHDGRLYGRGACDMKGGLAAAVIAVECLLAENLELPGALEISGTADEESGGYGGVAWLAKRGFFSRPRVDHVIIPEPLNVDRVCIGHRGVWWAEIETFGRIAHGSMPFLGDCAIRHMAAFLNRLERHVVPKLSARHTAMPVVPAEARHATLNLTAIHGGLADDISGGLPSPVVPDHCKLLIDRRFLAEEQLETVKAEVVDVLDQLKRERQGFDYGVKDVMTVMPTITPRDADLVAALKHGIEHVLNRPAEVVASPGTYDQKHVFRIGHLESCVAYGPGQLELAHQPDEFVQIDDLVASSKVMAAATLRLLGLIDR